MKRTVVMVISAVILAIAAYWSVRVVQPDNSVPLEECVHEIGIQTSEAYIVRDETVYYAPMAGTVYNSAAEGERVASGTMISSIYGAGVDATSLLRLSTINRQISLLTESDTDNYSGDAASAENDIANMINSVIGLEADDDAESVHSYRESINALRGGGGESNADRIAQLEEEKAAIEAGLSAERQDIFSDRAGIFTAYTDGFEAQLTPDAAKESTAEFIRSLDETTGSGYSDVSVAEAGAAVCKVMNNHVWYIMGIVPEAQSEPFSEDTTVTVRFSNLSGAQTSGKLIHLSDADESGECAFVVEVDSYLESAFSYRKVDADIVFESNEGYKVPQNAILSDADTGMAYVNAAQGSETYRCECEILYTDENEGYSIIRSTDTAVNRLAMMDRVVIEQE